MRLLNGGLQTNDPPAYTDRGLTALRISGRRTREQARGGGCPLQPLDGLARQRRDRKRMEIRSADGEARSVRAIVEAHRRQWSVAELPSECSALLAISIVFIFHRGSCNYQPSANNEQCPTPLQLH